MCRHVVNMTIVYNVSGQTEVYKLVGCAYMLIRNAAFYPQFHTMPIPLQITTHFSYCSRRPHRLSVQTCSHSRCATLLNRTYACIERITLIGPQAIKDTSSRGA